MRKAWLGGLLVAALVLPAVAKDTPSTNKGFWKVLVKPKAKWVLHQTIGDDKKATVTVETYDVRTIDGADVARLRWTVVSGDGKYKEDAATGGSQTPTQVAVTAKGAYFLTADMDDAKVSKALKGKPSRSDPPKAYKGTKKNSGRYLTVSGDVVCMGEEPLPGAGDCEDVCEGEVCYSATDGVISMHGTLAPNHDEWAR
jgi:hypothetical protein